jgi:hypothetical protein
MWKWWDATVIQLQEVHISPMYLISFVFQQRDVFQKNVGDDENRRKQQRAILF